MARKSPAETKADKLAKLEALKAEITRLDEREATRLGRLAMKAGLADLAIPDADLLAAFQDLAGRFRQSPQKPAPAPASALPSSRTPAPQDSV